MQWAEIPKTFEVSHIQGEYVLNVMPIHRCCQTSAETASAAIARGPEKTGSMTLALLGRSHPSGRNQKLLQKKFAHLRSGRRGSRVIEHS